LHLFSWCESACIWRDCKHSTKWGFSCFRWYKACLQIRLAMTRNAHSTDSMKAHK
jgi:hypothetical protein